MVSQRKNHPTKITANRDCYQLKRRIENKPLRIALVAIDIPTINRVVTGIWYMPLIPY